MDNIKKILDDFISECPEWIVHKSVEALKTILTDEILTDTKKFHAKDPNKWWAEYHHGWGTGIRNFLRDKVCKDDELPSKNWDDYYIQLWEMACGLREML